MLSKNEVINPNLLISIKIDDIEFMSKIAILCYGNDLFPEELDEKILGMQRIVRVFRIMGLSYDTGNIKKIVSCMSKQDRDIRIIIENYQKGYLVDYVPTGMNNLEFLAKMLNRVINKNYQNVEKIIGKKAYKKLFQGLIPQYYIEGKNLVYTNQASGS